MLKINRKMNLRVQQLTGIRSNKNNQFQVKEAYSNHSNLLKSHMDK